MAEQQLNVTLIPITQVHPDPRQPRRLLPKDLAGAFADGMPASEILASLRAHTEKNRGVRERMLELDALADSIAADGLYQPIRVIQEGDESYRIEQGERRWWAHHVLLGRGDERFRVIPAFVVEPDAANEGVLRRQVSENVHRADFTAMELARATANRIAEIASLEPGLPRREVERRVGKENGMSDRRVRQYLALLTLAPSVQELAQEARLGEGVLRPLAQIKEPERQMAALRKIMSLPRKRAVSTVRPSKLERNKRTKSIRARRSSAPIKRAKNPKLSVVDRVVRAARLWHVEQSKVVERELGARIFSNAKDYEAIAFLRNALGRALARPSPKHRTGLAKKASSDG
jgi:ParB/RepB/Spo0J family partition protein